MSVYKADSEFDDIYVLAPVKSVYRKFAKEDADSILAIMHNNGYKDLTYGEIQITSKKNTETDEIVTNVIIPFYTQDKSMKDKFPIEYIETVDGTIYADGTDAENAESLQNRLLQPEIYSSTSISNKRTITAAEGDDEFDDLGGEPTPGEVVLDDTDSVTDTVDELADTVDDIQDTLDDEVYDEDEPNIEMDNNISGHYIAECERCHGVFISAVMESDQEIDKISGVCPLCDKDTDQHLKWVIKDIDNSSK